MTFVRLPVTVDVRTIAAELDGLADEWRAHPSDYPGNTALPLIAVDGDPDNDDTSGEYAPTPLLDALPATRRLLDSFPIPLGRTRFMRLAAHHDVPEHTDAAAYWTWHQRIHVPIVTDEAVTMTSDGETQHLPVGEAWTFDNRNPHSVVNPTDADRVHLVIDTPASLESLRALTLDGTGLQVEPAPWASSYTDAVPRLLADLGCSLLVSTYQAGKLVVVRANADGLNTHFVSMPQPMGIAWNGVRLAVGTSPSVSFWRNQPEAATEDGADACLMPAATHITGDVRVHDLAYGQHGLWAVLTRFSALATIEPHASFTPQWTPPWVTELVAEDRCHLNGMALRDGVPRYMTALGTTNEQAGWREGKQTGGVLLDGGSVIADGLCMPHSPVWAFGALWFLNSGHGELCRVNTDGTVAVVAKVPGFARGLTVIGTTAFVGLSQVREHVFDEIPVRAEQAGVVAVDLVTGSLAGTLTFEGAVRELFTVLPLPFRWPEFHGFTSPRVTQVFATGS